MIERDRFRWALLAGLVLVASIMVPVVSQPQNLYALVGDRSSPGARLYAEDLNIKGLRLGGGQVKGVDITKFAIKDLQSTRTFVIERDIGFSSVTPTAQDWTITIRAKTANATSGTSIYTSQACLNGIGLSRFNLFNGLLDGLIKRSVRRGFRPSLFTGLSNLLFSGGLISLKVDRFYGEAMVVDAPRFTAPAGVTVQVGPKRVSPEFSGSCI